MKIIAFIQLIIYPPLKKYIFLGLKVFFNKYQIVGRDKVPRDGAVIFAVSHQNAFLDAMLVSCSTYRNPYFLTRGDVFKNPIANIILRSIRLLPIYRLRDGLQNVKKNYESIEVCKQILKKKRSFIIFPEGNHDSRWHLRPIQKGIARIAFETAAELNWQSGIKIVPVGIYYSRNFYGGGKVMVQFGDAIEIDAYQSAFVNQEKSAYSELLTTIFDQLKELLVHVTPLEDYVTKVNELTHKFPSYLSPFKEKELLNQKLQQQESPTDFSSKNKSTFDHFILRYIFMLFLPNEIPIFIINTYVKHRIKDHAFYASIKFTVGLIWLPLSYLCFASFFAIVLKTSFFISFIAMCMVGILLLRLRLKYFYPYLFQKPEELIP